MKNYSDPEDGNISMFVTTMNKLGKLLIKYQHNYSEEVGSSTIFCENQSTCNAIHSFFPL
jgi:hypothetical protein